MLKPNQTRMRENCPFVVAVDCFLLKRDYTTKNDSLLHDKFNPLHKFLSNQRGRISLVRGHCNFCLGNPLVHEGTTAIPMTAEGHQGKFKYSKGASWQTMHYAFTLIRQVSSS